MPPEPRAEAVWFGEQAGTFGMLHRPVGPDARTGVLLCSPFGWEDMACYATRGHWADALAAAGHVALRFDLPGTGDSAGGPDDDDLLGAWCTSVGDAAAVLAGRGCTRVAAIGLGFGGLVVLAAADRGARLDDLVLWGTPNDGRAFVRAERAFARMQTSNLGVTREQAESTGWLESGGYLLSAQTQEALMGVSPAQMRTGTLQRALLLDKDGMAPNRALVAALTDSGVDVEVAPGRGYSALMATPEHSRLTDETTALVERWLAAGGPVDAERTTGDLNPRTAFSFAGVPLQESAHRMQTPTGIAFGILTEPAEPVVPDACLVLLPAWAERRSGPNRLWTEGARRCAALGVPAFRVDLPGVGDATGDPSWSKDAASLHDATHLAATRAVLDGLEAAGYGSRFVLAGLSSGGYWGFRVALVDERVTAVLAINADGVLSQEPQAALVHSARKAERALQLRWWLLVLRGQVELRSVARVAGAVARLTVRRLRRSDAPTTAPKPSTAMLEEGAGALSDRGARLVVACTMNEPLQRELGREGAELRLRSLPGVEITTLPTLDHNLRPYEAQQATLETLDRLVSAVARSIAA